MIRVTELNKAVTSWIYSSYNFITNSNVDQKNS